jgi:CheY-like chemotaxis protein
MSAKQRRVRTIMLVEDYPETRLLLKDWLEKRGYRLVAAADGQEALDLAPLARPALILMDLRLPKLNGVAVIRRLRQNPELRDVPVVALTRLDPARFRSAAISVGFIDYLAKPIDLEKLEKVLFRLFGSHSIAAKASQSRS